MPNYNINTRRDLLGYRYLSSRCFYQPAVYGEPCRHLYFGRTPRLELNFPSLPVQPAHIPDLANILGVTPLFCGSNQIHYLLEVESEDIVRNLKPDFNALSNFPVPGIMITSISKGDFDFISRYFAPSVGNNEDPVTGSAHCILGPYWQQRLGKNTFTTYQASARGGIIKVTVQDDRVFLSGQAVTVLECTMIDSCAK